jgi:hypothetical protein
MLALLVATRYIIDKAAVAGVIIGVRLGIADIKNSNAQVFSFSLGKTNYDDIECEIYKVQIICLRQLEIVVDEFR